MEKLLALALKAAQEAEIFSLSVEETPVLFEANRLKHLYTRQRQLMVLRVIKDGKIGFAQSSGGDQEGLAERAIAVAALGSPANFHFPPRLTAPEVEVYAPETEALPLEQMVALGQALIDRARQHTPELVCEARVGRATAHIHLVNSRGGEISYRKTFFSLMLDGMLVRGTDMLFVGDSQSSCSPLLDTSVVSNSVIWQLELARNLAPAPSGQLPVVFTPLGAYSAFVIPLSVGFNGKMVLQGASPLKGRLNEAVFAPIVSLWDDATIPQQPFSRPYDDEGIPTRSLPLVEQGRVQGFLYDLQTAGLAGIESTGSASREGRGIPTPAVSNLMFTQGTATLAEMVADIKEGLVVDGLMGAEQGNVLGGDFSGNVILGYKIERGEIVGRVKDTMVSGNIYQALKEIVAMGREGRWVSGHFYCPPLYFPRLSIATKG